MKKKHIIAFVSLSLLFVAVQVFEKVSAAAEWRMLTEQSMVLYKAGRYEQAIEVAELALSTAEKGFGGNDLNVFTSLNMLGLMYCENGRFADAEPHYRRAVAIGENLRDSDHADLAGSFNMLGIVCHELNDYSQAEICYKRALAIKKKELGVADPGVVSVLKALAVLYRDTHRIEEAKALEERVENI